MLSLNVNENEGLRLWCSLAPGFSKTVLNSNKGLCGRGGQRSSAAYCVKRNCCEFKSSTCWPPRQTYYQQSADGLSRMQGEITPSTKANPKREYWGYIFKNFIALLERGDEKISFLLFFYNVDLRIMS